MRHPSKCLHCKISAELLAYVEKNPEACTWTILTDLGNVIADVLIASLPEDKRAQAVELISQSIRADTLGYDRTSIEVLLPQGTRPS